jgi:hypothetical protein
MHLPLECTPAILNCGVGVLGWLGGQGRQFRMQHLIAITAITDVASSPVVRSAYADPFYSTFAKEAISTWKDRDEWGDIYRECVSFLSNFIFLRWCLLRTVRDLMAPPLIS